MIRTWSAPLRALTLAGVTVLAGCAPGSLPGSPTASFLAGGGGRYNGTMTFARQSGTLQIDSSVRALDMSLAVTSVTQMSGRFTAGNASGTLQGILTGSLISGTFQGTALVSLPAQDASGSRTCEGRGDATATLVGPRVDVQIPRLVYDNCPGLVASSSASANSVSPIPETMRTQANVVVTVQPGTTIAAGPACQDAPGTKGWRFTVIVAETAGVGVNFDSTFIGEQRTTLSSTPTSQTLDMPFRVLDGGTRRTFDGCSPQPGTYQAFFSGTDANGHRLRFASPLVTLVP